MQKNNYVNIKAQCVANWYFRPIKQTSKVCLPPLRFKRSSASSRAFLHVVKAVGQPQTSFHHGITYTSYEGNTAFIKFNASGARVLIDPWFVGDLIFADLTWLYQGSKKVINRSVKVDLDEICSEVDVMLITQGLDDHCHLPTLQKIRKNLPVVAAEEAVPKLRALGFSNVTELDHGKSVKAADGKLVITGTAGALVGPPWSKRQLGFVLREPNVEGGSIPGTSIYFESHCDFDAASVASQAPVDVVVSSVKSALLDLGPAGVKYPLVQGSTNLIPLLKILKPKVLIPLLNTEVEDKGLLASVLSVEGDYDELQGLLSKTGVNTRVEFPAPPGESMAIAL